MATFEELFDEVLGKAKFAADAASKKTSEMVELGKLKYKAKQISWEIERTYSKLGVIVYEARKNGGDFDTVIDAAVDEIDSLNSRQDELEEKIRSYKKSEPRHTAPESEVEVEFTEVPAEPATAPEEETVVDFSEIKPEDTGEE